MNLYLIWQNAKGICGGDSYDSAVVCAESEERARLVHPNKRDDWDGEMIPYGGWCNAEDVQVNYIGKAKEGIKGVVCASFNAG